MLPTLVSFGFYLLMMIFIGFYFYEKKSSVEKYILGGRGLGSWVTAMSAQASDMSGWLLMGLPGSIYAAGTGDTWCAIGLAVGTFFNWILVAPRLRVYSEVTDSITVPQFMGNRLNDPTGVVRAIAALVTLGFFAIYAGSGLVAAGKLFESMFGIKYEWAVVLGAVVVLIYTLSGGFLAVCYTDLIQGILMFIAIVIVPLLAVSHLADGSIAANLSERGLSLSLLPKDGGLLALVTFIVSPFVWGLGYFGQPHIIIRFMGISSHKALKKSTIIAMIWVVISLAAAVIIGIIGIGLYKDPTSIDAEKVFIKMIEQFCNPWIGGIFLAAIMAAIMSTIDSQLLSASSALSQDFYKQFFRKEAGEHEMIIVNRAFVVVIMIFASSIALANLNTIFKIVQFAWGGFGAAFGPVILYSLYSRKMTWQAGLAGIIVGTAVMLGWKFSPLGPYMYEILPGFVANLFIITIVNHFLPQQNKEVLDKFDKMTKIIKGNADDTEKAA